jgi:hypothetical protein
MKFKYSMCLSVAAALLAASRAQAEEAVAVGPGNLLILFDTATPIMITTRSVTGLGANETIRGIDYRPVTGELIAGTVTTGSAANSKIFTYKIDHTTGAATFIGETAAAVPGAGDVPTGYDWIPFVSGAISLSDRMRYVNTNDENARINPDNGALAAIDTDLTPAATTTIIGIAYSGNVAGSTGSTLYVIDRNDSQIGIQGGINGTPSPNGGVVTDLAPLGFNLNQVRDGGFDITQGGTAFAALTNAATNLTGLYTLTLPTAVTATPAATFVGIIGVGSEIYSLTILPPDTDGDGVRDPLDGCPNDPAKTAPGVCGCGVADTDTDGDGTADCNDGCPDDGAKTAPGACGCGVADTDEDANGIADCNETMTACGACGPSASAAAVTIFGLFVMCRVQRRQRR